MDLAVLIVGMIIGTGAGYFIWGPGKEKMASKPKKQAKPKSTWKNPNED